MRIVLNSAPIRADECKAWLHSLDQRVKFVRERPVRTPGK